MKQVVYKKNRLMLVLMLWIILTLFFMSLIQSNIKHQDPSKPRQEDSAYSVPTKHPSINNHPYPNGVTPNLDYPIPAKGNTMVADNPMPRLPLPMSPPPKSDANSKGYGESGHPFIVERIRLHEKEKPAYDSGWEVHAFNQFASDRISVRRYLPDYREGLCRTNLPTVGLPSTAVIICFYNECWSTLLRSVHSVLDRTPPHLLNEIILVDDFSSHGFLKQPLDAYMKQLDKVRVIHTTKREGLIRARLIGLNHTTAKVVTFLDSHIECITGWLEPLLTSIKNDPTVVASPVIDRINDDNFGYELLTIPEIQVGGFDWDLTFNWHVPPKRDLERKGAPYSPIRAPTIAGGLFSIERDFFAKLGYYDPEFDVWGGENLELSFKTWMCGGSLQVHPCSHVGHVFRTRSPYSNTAGSRDSLRKNLVRLAEVWMDEYKGYFYERFDFDMGEFGNVSERKALREKLQSRSFDWYLDNVFPELFNPSKALATGDIANSRIPICLDASVRSDQPDLHLLRGYPCHGMGGNQMWYLTKQNQIRREDMCWTVAEDYQFIGMLRCQELEEQIFYYAEDGHIKHREKCIELHDDRIRVYLAPCSDSSNQLWRFNRTALPPPTGPSPGQSVGPDSPWRNMK